MSASGAPQRQIADIARQARELLGLVRESRWAGFEPPSKPAAAKPATDPARTPAPQSPKSRFPAPVPPAPIPGPATPSGNRLPLEPGPWRSLAEIAQVVSACTKCPLQATRTNTVPGEGAAHARLMFVGEAPGADEDRLGRPFVGAAGQLLDKMIGAMGLARDQVFIANTLKCRPPGNRDPQEQEVAACLPYLQAQIALICPEVICSLGRHATHALLERKDPLARLRGRFFEYRGTPLLPTFHPSYLLRTPADKNTAWQDLRLIMQRLGLPEHQPPATKAAGG